MLRAQLPVFAFLCVAASAQGTYTVPASHALVPGNSLEQQLFGFGQATYAQYVDKAEMPGLTTGVSLKELRYRREENRLDKIYATYEPMQRLTTSPLPNWEIRVGNFTGDYANLLPQYESTANGVTLTTVFAAQLNLTTNCPTLAAPPNPSVPAPFEMKFPFNVTTVLYSGAGLCVMHRVYNTRNYSHIYFVDSIYSQPTNGGQVDLITPTSVGCPAGFNRVYGTAPNPGGGEIQLHLFGGPADTPTLSYLGATAPNPIDLTFMGLPSCHLYTDLSVPIPTRTDFAGIASWRVPVPANPAYAGIELYNQWILADDRVSKAIPLAFSDGVRIKLGSDVGNNEVRRTVISALASQARATSGYIRPNQGAVFQLVY